MVSHTRQAYWLAIVATMLLAGCVTTEERPDGRTTVRFSATGAPSNTPANGSPEVVPTSTRSAPQMTTAKTVVASINASQRRDIEKGLACQMTSTLDASLKAAGIPVTGVPAPAPDGFSVFGLPVVKVAFSRESGMVSHTAYFAPGVSLQKVAAAAKLKGGKGSYSRSVTIEKSVIGLLTANVQNGGAVLQCVIDSEMDIE